MHPNMFLSCYILIFSGNSTKEQYYHQKLTNRQEAIEAVLYNTDAGIWHDFSLHTNKSREYFYMSNIFPVYMECTDLTNEKKEKLLQYLQVINCRSCLIFKLTRRKFQNAF